MFVYIDVCCGAERGKKTLELLTWRNVLLLIYTTVRQVVLHASVHRFVWHCQDGCGRNEPPDCRCLQTISACCYSLFTHTASICDSSVLQISFVSTKVFFSCWLYVGLKCQCIMIVSSPKWTKHDLIYHQLIWTFFHICGNLDKCMTRGGSEAPWITEHSTHPVSEKDWKNSLTCRRTGVNKQLNQVPAILHTISHEKSFFFLLL